ncbi:MAG: PLP-dependent aminotransferase family protein [Synergistales bacterium]|nr:PLP-dependent aminotransferase family protein [Synergistales bacterium]
MNFAWKNAWNRRTRQLRPSVIQEMMDLARQPGALSFTAGEPSGDLYPTCELRTCLDRTLAAHPESLGYPPIKGYIGLREWIADRMQRNSISRDRVDPEGILVTNGSQGSINQMAQLFLEEGDAIMLEDPSYPEAMTTFRRECADLLPVPMDEHGPLPEAMERHLHQKKVRFFYTIPTYQNPMGCSTSVERKKAILELARKHDFFIVEDDPYRDLCYEGTPPETYLHLAGNDDRVIYLGSLSKVLAPGIRCGWMAAPREVADKAVQLRLTLEIGMPEFLHRAVHELLTTTDFDGHLTALRDTYRSRRDALVAAVDRHLVPMGLSYPRPEGGFFLWATGERIGRDSMAFARFAAKEEKAAVVPGVIFNTDPDASAPAIRLSFAKASEDQTDEGMRRIAKALERFASA